MKEKLPNHVAIIMDGNRRWARKNGVPLHEGHRQGVSALSGIVESAIEAGIKVLTVYAFSTENWNRSQEEVAFLMDLLAFYLAQESPKMKENGVRLEAIGNVQGLPSHVQEVLQKSREATAKGERLDLVLALNYGGRDDLKRAMIRIVEQVQQGTIRRADLTEELISKNLDTSPWGDPDLLIRPSGEKRMSNFLLWQISYAEVVLTDVLWPDFRKEHLIEALTEYQKRDRRRRG